MVPGEEEVEVGPRDLAPVPLPGLVPPELLERELRTALRVDPLPEVLREVVHQPLPDRPGEAHPCPVEGVAVDDEVDVGGGPLEADEERARAPGGPHAAIRAGTRN